MCDKNELRIYEDWHRTAARLMTIVDVSLRYDGMLVYTVQWCRSIVMPSRAKVEAAEIPLLLSYICEGCSLQRTLEQNGQWLCQGMRRRRGELLASRRRAQPHLRPHCGEQGWEFALWFFMRIAPLLTKKSDPNFHSFLKRDLLFLLLSFALVSILKRASRSLFINK